MTAEEREARLTAYALNDAGLSPAARQEIEKTLAADSAARRAVEETRQLARVLTAGLAAEQAAMPAESVVTIPASKSTVATPARWMPFTVAAAVMLAVSGGTYLIWQKHKTDRDSSFTTVAATNPPANTGSGFGGGGGINGGFGGEGGGVRNAGFGTQFGGGAADGLKNDPDSQKVLDSLKDGDKGAYQRGDDTNRYAPKPTEGSAIRSVRPSGGSAAGDQSPASTTPATPAIVSPPPAPPGLPGFPGGPAQPGRSFEAPERADKSPAKSNPTSRAPGGGVPAGGKGKGAGGGGYGGRPIDGLSKGEPADGRRSVTEAGLERSVDAETVAPGDRHPDLIENSFTRVEGINALSTFGVDVDTASYAIVRKYLSMGQLPPANAIRLEEMVNYFPYADKPPEGADPFAVTVEMAECPWEPKHRLVRLGLKAKPIDSKKRPSSNLVFLIDVSGSMNAPNRLPLVKASLKLLVSQLGENDRVAMVVYAGTTGLVLDSTSAIHKDRIIDALDQLEAGGSTNGAGGIQQAYEVATANFIKNGTNRVILCTDGDWNVGTTSTDALVKLIEQKRESGVFLSVCGFGMGNLRDEMMVQLAGKGNGNYAYIDTLKEAHKAFVEQLGGTLVTVAKDVKVQVEFNPAVIRSYRLLGYEKRALAAKDFHDDKKDAGEMGAGHVVTALYELVPVGAPDPILGKVDGLRYQPEAPVKPAVKSEKMDEAFVVKMRHKQPDGDTSTLRERPVSNITKEYEKSSEDFQFAAAVASFAMMLKDSPYKGHSNYNLVLELAEAAKKHDPSGYRAEFVELVKKAKSLSGK